MGTFTGRVAVITGAAGGIGSATARRLAADGADLALWDLDEERLAPVAAQCRAAGVTVTTSVVDQTDPAAVEAGAEAAVADHGRIDVLAAVAGWGAAGTLLDLDLDVWRRHVDVLLTGTFVVCRTVARHMVDRRDGGAIVTVGSIGGIRHFNQFGAYCTAKAGVKMLTEGLASELGAHRIRVNCVLPGIIRTELAGPLLELSPTTSREALTRVPVGHFGEPDDVADAIAFLASDASRFVDGHSLVVDGGNLLHDHHWFHTDYSVAHQGDWTAI